MRSPEDPPGHTAQRFGAAVVGCGLLLLFFPTARRRTVLHMSVSSSQVDGREGQRDCISWFGRGDCAPPANLCRPMTGLTDQRSWSAGEHCKGAARSSRRSKGRRWS